MRPPVVVALLQVEGVVLVGLVGGAADEAVEDRRVVLDAGAAEGGLALDIEEAGTLKDSLNALSCTNVITGLVTRLKLHKLFVIMHKRINSKFRLQVHLWCIEYSVNPWTSYASKIS